jgi:hypothetical protein
MALKNLVFQLKNEQTSHYFVTIFMNPNLNLLRMKKLFTLFLFATASLIANAQLANPITFEEGMADTSWNIFANGTDSPDDIFIAANPNKNEVNMSDSVMEFVVHDNASPWVGMWSDYFTPIVITPENPILTMLVYKTIQSPVGMKLESSLDGGATKEIEITNNLTEEWEMISFDFTSVANFSYKRLTLFPDFPTARTEGTIVYLDQISNVAPTRVPQLTGKSILLYPNPVVEKLFIQYPDMKGISIYNAMGQTMKTYKFASANSKTIDVSDLGKGVFLLSVETNSGSCNAKFMKK